MVVDTDSHGTHHVVDCLEGIGVDLVVGVDILDTIPSIPAAPFWNSVTVGTVDSTTSNLSED